MLSASEVKSVSIIYQNGTEPRVCACMLATTSVVVTVVTCPLVTTRQATAVPVCSFEHLVHCNTITAVDLSDASSGIITLRL